MALDLHFRFMALRRASVVFCGMVVLISGLVGAADRLPGSPRAALLAQEATPGPTATWRGPVVTAVPGATHPGVLAPLAADAQDTLAVSAALEMADGSGGDGTLRQIVAPVLMYHYISVPPEDADVYRRDLSVTPEDFRAQMQYLADAGHHVVSLYDLNLALRWGAPLPSKPVVLTFDDGYADAYENAFPVLQEFGFTGTFFVITTRLDEGNPAYLSWTQVQEMAGAGMSIESHTKDHLNMTGRDTDFLVYQIEGSIESITAHTGQPAHLFCYPAGRWDETVLGLLDSFGVWAAVTTENGAIHTTDGTHLLRRVRISGDTDLAVFAALLHLD